MKIIIVENEIRIREGIHKLLMKISNQYEVIGEAENGEEGLKMIKELGPDLVITDIKMPIMDGLEMLTACFNHDIKTKAIVLSAYSEFTYAQKAIKLGVSEYLLKPIDVSGFTQSMKNIENQLELGRKKNPESIGTLENVMMGIIFGRLDVEKDLSNFIEEKYHFKSDSTYVEMLIYLGKNYKKEYKRAIFDVELSLHQRKELEYCILEIEKESMILLIVYGCKNYIQLERWYQNQILLNQRGNTCRSYGWSGIRGLEVLKEGFHTLLQYMDWNISLGDAVMISYPKVTYIQTVHCIYPIEIENKIKIAICVYDNIKLDKLINEFVLYFKDGKIYSPKQIKESFVRFMWAIINISKEIGAINYQKLDQQKLLETVMNAKMYGELEEAVKVLAEKLNLEKKELEIETNLSVKRTQSLIHEFYQRGITLDEIADKLSITPEYLSAQFHKETGINFSGYIKKYRINKAKELLIGTHLKLYEISEKVGYSDAKYFSRVFRESTGQLPAEYRKTHK